MQQTAKCCIAGGGPAGVMLGYLLARTGIDVVVLEKHADFFRDFRGDTIHPSTLQVMDELGILDDLLKLPHQEVCELWGRIGGVELRVVDLRFVPGRCKFIAFMPQWDFLNFLTQKGRAFPQFRLEMNADVDELLFDGERVVGIRAHTPAGPLEIRAPLVVAADGRSSIVRERAGMEVQDFGVPIDALWLRLPKRPGDPGQTFGSAGPGAIFVTIDRGDYYQCAFVIQKGGFERMRERGIEEFRHQIAELVPFLANRVAELRSWDDVKLLTVMVNRLRRWYRDGLLFIGDAAHAMSPVGGVGINLAIQDAVASANILAADLKNGDGAIPIDRLAAVQRRREFPTKVIQGFQVFIHERALNRVLNTREPFQPPLFFRLLDKITPMRSLPAYFIGVGPRPEHVRIPILQ